MNVEKALFAARVSAANSILDMGFGKPTQKLESMEEGAGTA
jgi:hypothetical protein